MGIRDAMRALGEAAEEQRAKEAALRAERNLAGTAKLIDLSNRIARKVRTTGARWKIWNEAWLGSDELEPQWIQLAILGELRAIRQLLEQQQQGQAAGSGKGEGN
jgi:hypothetical protein